MSHLSKLNTTQHSLLLMTTKMANSNDWDSDYLASLYKGERKAAAESTYAVKRSNFVRKYLVGLIARSAETLGQPQATLYLAVSMLDSIPYLGDLRLLAVTCLYVASKLSSESVQRDIPKLSELSYLTGVIAEKSEFMDMECFILQTIQWNVSRFVSPNDFMNYWFQNPENEIFDSDLKTKADEICLSFMTLDKFRRHPASVVAASCMAVAHIRSGLLPIWPSAFSTLTGYGYAEIEKCLQDITWCLRYDEKLALPHNQLLQLPIDLPNHF